MSHRILFVEDEVAFAVGLVDLLQSAGHEVEHVRTGGEGFERARRGRFDLIVLDVMLPDQNGLDICRDLRRVDVETPIVMLTALGQLMDKVLGLKLGADDYVVKNCEPMELLARVEALLRRTRSRSPSTAGVFELDDLRVDFDRHEVTRNGQAVPVSAVEMRLLKYLIQHRGFVVTREELLEKVWGMNREVLSRTVDVHLAALRKKLERDPKYPELILTVKGVGYKLV